jgi:hypothetical protein
MQNTRTVRARARREHRRLNTGAFYFTTNLSLPTAENEHRGQQSTYCLRHFLDVLLKAGRPPERPRCEYGECPMVPWESWLIRSPHTRKILGSNPSGTTSLFLQICQVCFFSTKFWEPIHVLLITRPLLIPSGGLAHW